MIFIFLLSTRKLCSCFTADLVLHGLTRVCLDGAFESAAPCWDPVLRKTTHRTSDTADKNGDNSVELEEEKKDFYVVLTDTFDIINHLDHFMMLSAYLLTGFSWASLCEERRMMGGDPTVVGFNNLYLSSQSG